MGESISRLDEQVATDSNGCCVVCGGRDLQLLLEIGRVPIQCHVLCATAEEANNAALGNITLVYCSECTMIFNRDFDPGSMAYVPGYDNALHYSPRFQAYAEDLAKDLVDRYGLHNKTIVEIGCGDGYFLKRLCQLGGNRGWGFDPSCPCPSKKLHLSNPALVADYFDASLITESIDFLCCRHVLEHIQEPQRFIRDIWNALPIGASFYLEVPDTDFTLSHGGIWDILYEHCSYYLDSSLARLVIGAGFKVATVGKSYGQQFLYAEGEKRGRIEEHSSVNTQHTIERFREFAQVYYRTVDAWNRRLDEFDSASQKVAIWGAGTKGIMFLNTVAKSDSIDCVVDVNPNKSGRFIAGQGTPVVFPSDLPSRMPDIILVANPIYRLEIGKMLNSLGVQAEVILLS